ncbi:trypsin-like serine protease [Streptomyces sp. NPDC055692]|uniref:trypsin-like serine protease n=1 Tax=Streptomyces sp. NPDC055692 TaxID=3155683 RepID=UPI003435C9C7
MTASPAASLRGAVSGRHTGRRRRGDGPDRARPSPAQAITGGREARVAEFPYTAGLVDVGSAAVFCGGTLISDPHVVTAAHGVRGEHADPSRVAVRLSLRAGVGHPSRNSQLGHKMSDV